MVRCTPTRPRRTARRLAMECFSIRPKTDSPCPACAIVRAILQRPLSHLLSIFVLLCCDSLNRSCWSAVNLADGLEDLQLFRLCDGRCADLLQRLVRSGDDWTDDPKLLEATRREAAHRILSYRASSNADAKLSPLHATVLDMQAADVKAAVANDVDPPLSPNSTCRNLTVVHPGLHWPRDAGQVLSHGPQLSASSCAAACCAVEDCSHWVWGKHEPFVPHDSRCVTGQPCCWLKGGDTRRLVAVPNANDTVGVLSSRQPPLPPSIATFHINRSAEVLPRMDPRFVSVGCESFEWLFDQRALDQPMLQAVTRMLSPGFLRVGGTTSDYLHWVGANPENSPRAPYPLAGVNTVNTTTFDALIQFCRRTNMSLIYDMNELYGPGGRHRVEGAVWNSSGTVALLRHAKATGAVHPAGPLYALELGNELQHGPISEHTIADDYAELRRQLDDIFGADSTHPLLYGPSANSCGTTNSALASFVEEAEQKGARLDGLTWHVYPLKSPISESVLDPSRLRSISPGDCFMKAGRTRSKPLRLALTESNSNAMAHGGSVGQDRFANGFWYIASLGSAAIDGLQFHARWKLWNPRVSYYDGALNQTFGFLNKGFDRTTPDYFVALLHKKLIGDGAAVPVQSSNPGVLAWVHCPSRDYMYRLAAQGHAASFVTMFANPLNETVNVSIHTGGDVHGETSLQTHIFEEFVLTAANKQDGVLSIYVSLNGGKALALEADGTPPALDGRRRAADSGTAVRLPPESYGFLVYGGPPLRACASDGPPAAALR
eukprot:SAG11_NODE_415_length_9675_cov_2.425961_5_plen_775_part_00